MLVSLIIARSLFVARSDRFAIFYFFFFSFFLLSFSVFFPSKSNRNFRFILTTFASYFDASVQLICYIILIIEGIKLTIERALMMLIVRKSVYKKWKQKNRATNCLRIQQQIVCTMFCMRKSCVLYTIVFLIVVVLFIFLRFLFFFLLLFSFALAFAWFCFFCFFVFSKRQQRNHNCCIDGQFKPIGIRNAMLFSMISGESIFLFFALLHQTSWKRHEKWIYDHIIAIACIIWNI